METAVQRRQHIILQSHPAALCLVLLLLLTGQPSRPAVFRSATSAASSGGTVGILRDLMHDACVTVSASTAGANLMTSYCGSNVNAQTYTFTLLGDGSYKIYTLGGSAYCLSHLNNQITSNVCSTDPSQEWFLEVVTNGMRLETVDGVSCLSDPADWNSTSTTMQACNVAANQIFQNTAMVTAPSGACGATPNGSTVWINGAPGSSTAAATAQQCPNGGSVTTTWITQSQELCTNGALTNTGGVQQANVTTGAPVCNAGAGTGTGALTGTSSLRDLLHDACATVLSQAPNSSISAESCGGLPGQYYVFSALNDGNTRISTFNGSTYCLAHASNSVLSTTCSNDSSQEWSVKVGSSSAMIETIDGTSCLADPSDWNSNATTMQACNSGAQNEQFQVSLSASPSGSGATSASTITVLPASNAAQTAPPGATINIGANFSATSPASAAYALTISLVDTSGNTAASTSDTLSQFDSTVPTTQWQGPITVVRSIQIPSVANQTYQVMISLVDPSTNRPVVLSASAGVTQDNQNRYCIGSVTVQSSAPSPSLLAAQTLDLTGYTLTFDDEFKTLDLSDSTAYDGSKWYTHNEQCCMQTTDGSGTFMYGLTDPVNPYSLAPGGLDIRLQKINNNWSSGVITSVDNKGVGFSQQYGYFEMSAQFPSGLNTWPAFWLLNSAWKASGAAEGEIDIVEYIANPAFNNTIRTTLHNWSTNTAPDFSWNQVTTPSDGKPHRYGMLWTAQTMTFYFDGTVIFACPTPSIMQQPYYLLVDLGIGSGYPTDATPVVDDMIVNYVRAYSLPSAH